MAFLDTRRQAEADSKELCGPGRLIARIGKTCLFAADSCTVDQGCTRGVRIYTASQIKAPLSGGGDQGFRAYDDDVFFSR